MAGPGDSSLTVGQLQVGDLTKDRYPEAVELLARGMRDNPIHVAVYGRDPKRRERRHARVMAGFFAEGSAQQPIAAWFESGELAGVAGMFPVGSCSPGLLDRIRILATLLPLGLPALIRTIRWSTAWAVHDLPEPHIHLGPVAVDSHLQGRGIGSLLMTEFCLRQDRGGQVAYLETDRPENVRFYERFGFRVIGEERVLGVPCWFMRRG